MKLLVFCVGFIFNVYNVFGVQVQVEQGLLSGEELELVTKDGTYISFKGIPYAAPPVGTLRFKAPQPPLPWEGVRNATEHGASCPQVDIFTNVYNPGSEDCLFLNVYTQTISPEKPQPVMFFIHGGDYVSESSNSSEFGPDFLVSKGVVVVTINYRLGALGFLCMDTKDVPGNAALKDQLAAMKWVKKNIAKFGGDPDNVTIFGQSAGGSSVAYHTISPLSKGYFKRAIVMSGSPLADWTMSYKPTRRAYKLGQVLSNYTVKEENLLEFLQSVPYEQLVKTKPMFLISEDKTLNIIKENLYTPVVEKDFGQEIFLPKDPADLLAEGKVNKVDLMSGYTNGEALLVVSAFEQSLLELYNDYVELFVPYKMFIRSNPETNLLAGDKIREYFFGKQNVSVATMKEMVNYASNSTFVLDLQRYARKFPKTGQNQRYFYKFSCYSKLNVRTKAAAKYGLTGTGHMEELLYIFYQPKYNVTIQKNTREYDLIEKVTTIFTNFAKFGNPTPDSALGVIWPQFDNKKLKYVDINDKLTVGRKPDEVHMQFWKKILSLVKIVF